MKQLGINVALAALAAFSGAIVASEGAITKALLIAAAYAAVRAAAGAVVVYVQSRKG